MPNHTSSLAAILVVYCMTSCQVDAQSEVKKASKKRNAITWVALGGRCPVALLDQQKWVSGHIMLRQKYRGVTYRFETTDAMDKFCTNKQKYALLFDGFDIVLLKDRGVLKRGKREFGVYSEIEKSRRIIVFATEESKQKFIEDKSGRYNQLVFEQLITNLNSTSNKTD